MFHCKLGQWENQARATTLGELVSEVIESHYLETQEGLFFAVKGLVHPPDRFFACLRYAPDPDSGDRRREGRRYRRLYHFAEQEQFLQTEYGKYLIFDPNYRTTLQCVPREWIHKVYDPRARLQALAQQKERDPVEEDALAFAVLLQQEASIPWTGLGISGSLLIALHTAQSDLDITVYGVQNCRAVHRALKPLLDTGSHSGIRRNNQKELGELYAARTADTQMDFDDFLRSENSKVNQGRFRDREYFIRFLKHPEESEEVYGDYHYTPLEPVRILATVTDASEAIFTPCRYCLAEVHFMEKSPGIEITEAVSYRGRFCEQAQVGERVLISGTLERIQAQDGKSWHRLLLGNHFEDTMILWR